MLHKRHARIGLAGLLAFAVAAASTAPAKAADEAVETYYKGKRINLLIGTDAGGSADLLGRVIARYLTRHLPGGGANVVPQNMPGGGSVPMMNHLYNVADRNGTAMGIIVGGLYLRHHFSPQGIRHDLKQMIPIFNPEGGGAVIYVGTHLGVKAPQDIVKVKQQVAFGFQTPEGNSAILGMAGFSMLKVPYKGISGYKGSNEVALAVERKELDSGGQTPPAYHASIRPKVEAGQLIALFQSGLWKPETNTIVKDPAVPDVPTFGELYRQIYGTDPSGPLWDAWFMPLISYARYTVFFPPGVPAAALEAVNLGLDAMCKDPEYQAEVQRIEVGPRCYLRQEARAISDRAAAAPPEAVKALKALLP